MKKKVDWSMIKVLSMVILFFGLFVGITIYAFNFAQNKQMFIRDSALFVAGDVEVYAHTNGENVKLSDMTRGNLGGTLTAGDRKYADKKMKTTGNEIVVYSINRSEGKTYRLVVSELENEKARVVLEGRKKTHSYDTQTRYKTFYRLLSTEDDFRENKLVDTIPTIK